MQTDMNFRIFSLLLLAFGLTATSYAQEAASPDCEKTCTKAKANREGRAELRQQLHEYRATNMLPVLTAERKAFDSQLTADERATLAAIRSRREANRSEHRGKRHAAKRTERQRPSEQERAAHRAEREADRAAVRKIAEAHRTELEAIGERLRPQHETWRKEMRAIREQYAKTHPTARKQAHHRGGKGHAAARFLLLDPAGSADSALRLDGNDQAADQSLRAYPNPASDRLTVEVPVRAAGATTVELLDASGRVLATEKFAAQDAEQLTHTFLLPADVSGTLLVRVSDAQGQRTKPVARQ